MFSIFKHLLLISFAVSILCEDLKSVIEKFKRKCESPKGAAIFPGFSQAFKMVNACMKGSQDFNGCPIIEYVGSNPKEMANPENCEKNAKISIQMLQCFDKAKDKKKYMICLAFSFPIAFNKKAT
ncbi:uncharacterized protein LOC141855679 [Brevipalpus obovatus]|uniref:uncharacterized protein LOC141855679 n=1 Tax=Brevipalpus obovatus TaxID=246614 RepID=UPI003D9DBC33